MRLVTKVFEEPMSFILSNVRDTDIDTYIRAPTADVKEEWTREIQAMIDKQRDFLQGKKLYNLVAQQPVFCNSNIWREWF